MRAAPSGKTPGTWCTALNTGIASTLMRISVDTGLCESNALCVGAAPEVFELSDDDLLQVLVVEPPEELRAAVEAAARVCPKQAILIRE